MIYLTQHPKNPLESIATGRRSDLVASVVSELRGINTDFEYEEDIALRIIELVEDALMEAKSK
jgi:hypothetical protein